MKTHWLEDTANIRRLWRGFLALLALLVLAELAIDLSPHFAIERVFGFHAWFGFAACAVSIVLAKLLGAVLKRADTYYEGES